MILKKNNFGYANSNTRTYYKNMDFFKKLSSSEKKFQFVGDRISNCRLRKVWRQAVTPAPPIQPTTPVSEEWDPGIVVARPHPIIRLVLFKELGDCDRPILFDSKSFERSKSNDLPGTEKYQYVRSPSDWKVLSEMLFGSVGMTQKAASLKIHSIKSPPSIMLSRVFCLSPRECATVSLDRGIDNPFEFQRAISISSRRKANTMPVPQSASVSRSAFPSTSVASSYSSQYGSHFPRSDSGISLASMSSSSYQPSTPSYPSSSLNSALVSSGSYGKSHSLPKNNKRDSFTVSDEFVPNEKFLRRTRTKIGFAVICVPEPSNMTEFQRFFFEHFPIIESHMTALKENIEKAFQLRPKANFIDLMMKALDEFTSKLHAIYSSQRLPEPVWSTLHSPQLQLNHRRLVVKSFIADLSRLVSDYNTKQRNCFVTSLLTAVLTYHLGWVSSVSPAQEKEDHHKEDEYNALWAQLGDLYGAVGSPTKVCRTIVTGSCHELVSTFLSVLSYFIRSSRVDDVIKIPTSITPYTMGIEEPPPMMKVSVETVPCDLDNSDDYLLISVVEDDDKKETEEKTDLSSCTHSPSKTPVLRSKSSPHKSKIQVNEEDDEPSSLTRSYSGPMIRRSSRPRSDAIIGNRFPTRPRTYSSKLSKPRGVQSRRRSHETTADVTMSNPNIRYNLTRASDGDVVGKANKSSIDFNVQGSFCMRQTCDRSCFFTSVQHEQSCASDSEDIPENEIRKAHSFVDIVEPQIERLVHVQRSACDVAQRPTDLFLETKFFRGESKSNVDSKSTTPENTVAAFGEDDFRSLTVTRFGKDEHLNKKVETFKPKKNNKKDNSASSESSSASKSFSKTKKVTHRRTKLPESNFNTPISKSDYFITQSSTIIKPKYLRIPSVEMNHNAFEEYFDNESSLPETSKLPSCLDENHKELSRFQSSTPHVISCPNFESLLPNSTTCESSEKVKSIYPKLDLPEAANPTLRAAVVQPKIERLYPSLPHPEAPFNSVTFNVNSEEVAFKRQNLNSVDLPSPCLSQPSMPCLNTVQSTRTVTSSDELFLNEHLQELPLADINYCAPPRMTSEDRPSTPTGFASLMADYGQEYMNDFILHGAPNQTEMHKKVLADLEHGFKNSTLDEPVSESVCIVADTDTCSVKVYRSHRLHEDQPYLPALSSKLVCNILNRISTMAKMKMSPEFCLTHLESELRQLVLKSHVLAEYTQGRKRVTMAQLSAALNIESRDLPLLMSIASCHSPHVALMML